MANVRRQSGEVIVAEEQGQQCGQAEQAAGQAGEAIEG